MYGDLTRIIEWLSELEVRCWWGCWGGSVAKILRTPKSQHFLGKYTLDYYNL